MHKIGFFILLILPLFGYAQQPYFQNLVSSDGIESNTVYCCFQDKEGYMWFGTDLGVSRFDGYEFENFDSEDGLTGNEIFGMFQDSKERIWFRSFNGEFSYYLMGEFYNGKNDSTLAKLKSDPFLSSICEDQAGSIYIATSKNGLFIIDSLGNVKNLYVEMSIYEIWIDRNEAVKMLTSEGVYRIEGRKCNLENDFQLTSSYPRSVIVDNKLYFGHGSNILTVDSTLKIISVLPNNAHIIWVGRGNGNNLFVGTREGLFSFDFDKRALSTEHYFPESIVSYTLVDREGNLWLTTLGEGVFLSPSPQTKIYNKEGDLPVSNITCLANGLDNDLWIGMAGGYFANLKNGVLKKWRIANHDNQPITRIRIASEGQILIANKSNVAVLDEEGVRYFSFLSNDILVDSTTAYIASNQTFKISRDFFYGQLVGNPTDGSKMEKKLQEKVMFPASSSVLIKGNGNCIYVGSQIGLFKKGEMEKFDLSQNSKKLGGSINDLAYDLERELLFVATNSDGLLVLEDDRIKYVFNEANGLSGNNCQSLLLDDGELWVGTTKSVDRIYLHENQYKVVNHGALLNLKDTKISDIERVGDVLYIATSDGLIAQNLNMDEGTKANPKLFLEHIYVNSIEREISENKMQLKHNENSIAFSFLGLSYKNLSNLTYEYKLVGYPPKAEWHKTKSREVFFDGLDAGDYTFLLRIKNWENQEMANLSFPFQIEKPFWKTAWFLTLTFCVIVGLVMLIWFVRIRNIRSNYELEKQFVTSEMEKLELEKAYLVAEQKAGVLQMNPHFLFNSLNTIKGYYAQNKFNEANQFIARFSKLLRRILECNTQFIPLQKELEIVDLYLFLMQKRYDNMFDYHVICDLEGIDQIEIPPMMVQPMVENAVVHGIAPLNKGLVEVRFYYIDQQLACSVSDTGVGFNNSLKQMHESVGLSNIRDRLNLLSKQFNIPCTIKINSPTNKERNEGTTITILFPTKMNSDESYNN